MTPRQLSAKPGEDSQAPSSVYATHSDDDNARPEKAARRPFTAFGFGAGHGCGQHLIYDLGLPRDIC